MVSWVLFKSKMPGAVRTDEVLPRRQSVTIPGNIHRIRNAKVPTSCTLVHVAIYTIYGPRFNSPSTPAECGLTGTSMIGGHRY